MKKSCLPFVLLLTSALIPAVTTAADPIVVTATRTPVGLDDTLVSTTVIERAEIEQSQAVDVIDLLRRTTGVETAVNGGPGQTASVFLRGAESDHTLVLIDGVKMNPGTLGVAAIQNIPVSMIERIEVTKGPRATLYGSDAIGGVIQIFTRRESAAEAAVRFGSHDTRDLSLNLHRRDGDTRFGVDLAWQSSDGFPARSDAMEDSPWKNGSVNLYGGTETLGTRWTLQHLQSEGRTDYYDFLLTPVDQDFRNAVSSLKAENEFGENWFSRLTLSHFVDEIDQNQSDDYLETRRDVLDWQNDVALGDIHLLTAGLQLSREQADAVTFGTAYADDSDSNEIYLQDQVQWSAHQLQAGVRVTDHSSFAAHTTGDLNYGYTLAERTLLSAALGTGFRAPSSTDRFGFGGNPELEPETSRYLELALQWTGDGQRLRAGLFENEIDDLINFVDPDGFDGPLPGRNENIDATRTRGLELTYLLTRGPWRLDAGLLLQDPEDLASGRQLPRRAKQRGNLSGHYIGTAYDFGIELEYVGERPDSFYSDELLEAYTLVDLTAARRIAEVLQAGLRLHNLSDEDYQLAAGYNTAGRSLYFTLRYQPAR